MRRRNDQLRPEIRSDRGCAIHRTQRRVRAIGTDHDGLIGAHFPECKAEGGSLECKPMSRSPAGRWPTMVLSLDPGTHTVYVTNLGLGFNSVSVIESR
jgi:hypothetical protein